MHPKDLTASVTYPDGPGGWPLEPSAPQMRRMAAAVSERLAQFAEGLPAAPAVNMDDVPELIARVREPAPEHGSEFDGLVDIVMEAATRGIETAGPGFLAYVPGGGIYTAAVADFLACGINRYVALSSQAPVLAAMEWTAVRWLCDLFGYPGTARGVLTSGGSMSTLGAIVAARHACLSSNISSGVLYVSDQAHACVAKAAAIAGFLQENVRTIRTDDRFRIDVGELRKQIRGDLARGRRPFCVIGTAGTTNTGAIDPLPELAAVARSHDLWFHVDAAYGGFFQLTERGRAKLRGIGEADSITVDPHKGLFLPYGTGALLARDGARLRAAFQASGEYLQDMDDTGEIPNFSDLSPELSRDFRGLRLWLAIKLHGWAAFREALDEKLDLSRTLFERLCSTDRLQIAEPDLTVLAFRCAHRPGHGPDDGRGHGHEDELTRRVLDRINASRRVYLSSTRLRGRFTIRACVLCFRTHRDRVEEAAEIIREAARDVMTTA
jgi:aromatic-L-amino-acid decarboxylase